MSAAHSLGGVLTICPAEEHDGQLSPSAAKVKTAELRLALGRLADALAEAHALVLEVWEGRADIALGHPSWADYCHKRLAVLQDVKWPPATRRAVAEDLRVHGMSYRAIAAVLGVSVGTVSTDCSAMTGRDHPVEVVSLDGRRRPASTTPAAPAKRRTKTALAVESLLAAGPTGLTWAELGRRHRWHHGQSSSTLTALHLQGRIVRTEERRDGSGVYVHPDHVGGRDVEQPAGARAALSVAGPNLSA